MSVEPENCAGCGELAHFPEQTIDLTGGGRKVYHHECWLDKCYEEAHPEESEAVTEDDCF